ncbi:UNKNOWN [Stylonychia lemnae]|uniref:Uncharacterized protein n=1 Tax=Stylonychia lemnae TaxID=5949 RepID=A0A078AHR8_STYLE|nr:UNKNOWN [Stylonychia lemnae]|eukprot:CDW81416.1 UNKNOWN [Stylonychia lemnae]
MKASIIILAITLTSAVNALVFNEDIYRLHQEELLEQYYLNHKNDRNGLIANKLKPQQKIPPEFLQPIGACGMFNPPPHCREAHQIKNDNARFGYRSALQPNKFNTPKVQGVEDFNSFSFRCQQFGECHSLGFNPDQQIPADLKDLIIQLKKSQM